MTKRILPTPEELRQLLRYEPETGKLYWKPRPEDSFATIRAARSWNSKHAWQEAFLNSCPAGYRKSYVKNINMSAHRVAWAIYYGEWPEESIDFINNVKKDVRIANLRSATNSQV